MGFFSSVATGLQNLASGATFGAIPRDTSQDATSKSFEQRFSDLKTSGAYGNSSSEQKQNQNLDNSNYGFNQLSDLGNQIIANENSATALYDKGFQQNANSIAAEAQLAPLNAGDAARAAQDSYDMQRNQAIQDKQLIQANELQNNIGQLAGVGSTLAQQNSDAYNTNLFAQAGLEANRTANQNALNIQNTQLQQQQTNALLGLGSTVGATAYNAFNSPNTQQQTYGTAQKVNNYPEYSNASLNTNTQNS